MPDGGDEVVKLEKIADPTPLIDGSQYVQGLTQADEIATLRIHL